MALPSKSLNAYTLAEVLVTVMAITITGVGLFGGISNINDYAAINRLETCATTIVQDQINRALREKPFVPPANIPPALTTSSTTVSVYTDPPTGISIVSGTLAVTVSGTSVPLISGTPALTGTVYEVNVSLSYSHHSKNYKVQMSAVRSPDPN